MYSNILSLFIAVTAALTLPRQLELGAPVSTSSGTVTGTVGAIAKDVSVYYGIPYAQPPIRERRFLAPQKFEDRARTIDGKTWGKDCIGVLPMGGSTMDEDCLTLNVWAPRKKAGDLKAVLVWIYGGAFMSGTANMWVTDGSRLASSQDVVVVAINYRLSIFGFPGAPGLPDQNLGILDQRMAVEWVRDNIKEFGGDPDRITLFGQSAGGDSVDIYSYAWLKDPIVKGLIAQSGASTMCGLITESSRNTWPKVVDVLKCQGSNELHCVRSKSGKELMDAVKQFESGFPAIFSPMPDGKIVFDDYESRAKAGKFIKVPLIIGTNNHELGAAKIFAAQEFDCPVSLQAGSRVAAGVKAYRYRYFAGQDDSYEPSKSSPLRGLINSAMHAGELPYVFNTIGQLGIAGNLIGLAESSQNNAVANDFQRVWAAFAKDPVHGATKMGWTEYNPIGDTLNRVMYGNETSVSFTRGNRYDSDCPRITCAARPAGKSKGDDRLGSMALGLGSFLLNAPNLAGLGLLLENGVSLVEATTRILAGE